MANFRQHISFGFICTGLLTAPLLAAGYITTSQASLLWLTGTLGSIIPDIDSDNAFALDIVFMSISLLLIYSVLNNFALNRSGLEIIGMVTGTFTLCLMLRLLFQRLTVHRGAVHSLLAAVFFGLVACVFTRYVNQVPATTAWLAGSFMTIGAISHLILDEIYSVDLMNVTIKRSFGSAFKVISLKHWPGNLLLLAGCAGLWYLAPPVQPFLDIFGQPRTYSQLLSAMMPGGFLSV